MKIKNFLLASAVLFSTSAYGSTIENVELSRVIAGDIIAVNISDLDPLFGVDLPIRLRGIDAPPLRYDRCQREAELGELSRSKLRTLLREAQTITLQNPERGKFFRLVADVYIDGPMGFANVGDLLQIAGLAVPYNGRGDKPNWCAAPIPSNMEG